MYAVQVGVGGCCGSDYNVKATVTLTPYGSPFNYPYLDTATLGNKPQRSGVQDGQGPTYGREHPGPIVPGGRMSEKGLVKGEDEIMTIIITMQKYNNNS